MNPEQLRAFLERNKVALGAAGAAAVAGVALLRSRSAKSTGPAQASLPALGSALSAGGAPVSGTASSSYYPVSYVGASGGYDSTGTDVYNAIQPQLEYLQRLAEKNASPIPVTAPDYSYIAIAGDPDNRGAVYQVNSVDGTRDYLTGAEWAELGTPKPKFYTKDDPIWSKLSLRGDEAWNASSWWKSGTPPGTTS